MPCNYNINKYNTFISEVGGVVQALVLPPNREIDFDCACVCVACVRASEPSCERETIPLWLGLARGICRSVVRGGRARSELKVRAVRASTDDMRSL